MQNENFNSKFMLERIEFLDALAIKKKKKKKARERDKPE